MSSDAKAGASSPQVLRDVTVPSNTEFVVMSDDACKNGDCGFVRPDTVAYRK